VKPTVPGDVDKTHQSRANERRDVNKTAAKHGLEIAPFVRWPSPFKKGVQFLVRQSWTPRGKRPGKYTSAGLGESGRGWVQGRGNGQCQVRGFH
jgi:hypothetical protein